MRSWVSLLSVLLCLGCVDGPFNPDVTPPPAPALALVPGGIGHWHVYTGKTVSFTVTDAAGAPVSGLDVTIKVARDSSSRIAEHSVAKSNVRDEGGGRYAMDYTPSYVGSYALTAQATVNGYTFASVPVPFAVVRDGEEDIRVDAAGTSFVYQVRYNWDPGHVHASDEDAVKLNFELLRGIPEGDEIQWERAWENPFDAVTNATGVVVEVTPEGGTADVLTATYRGRGVYEAQRMFAASEVGAEKNYDVRVRFTDPRHGAEVTHREPYRLHAVAAH